MLNKELLIIALVVILGLSAVILLQNYEHIADNTFSDFYDHTSQDSSYHNNNEASS